MENNEINVVETAEPAAKTEQKYSPFRYGLGAVLAFFGFSSKTHRASKKRQKLVGDIFTYIILLFGSFLMVYPFWWMLAGSFANTSLGSTDVLNNMIWWPSLSMVNEKTGLFGNYSFLFKSGFSGSAFPEGFSYWRALGNNLIYSLVPVIVGVITSAAAAFSFAKIEWIGRNKVFFFLLAAIMVPGPSIMTSQYAIYRSLGWIGKGGMLGCLILIVPGLFGSIMTAFFIRQFLFGLPTSIIEAAKIDGAGYFRIFCGFILPLAMPAIMAQGLLSFMGCWNNYMGSFIFLDSSSPWINLPHAMYMLDQIDSVSDGPVIAASVICVLPVIILFAAFQKLIIGSLMLTGSKE